ncbi:putative sulfate exporter family transporter [Shinella yambaruensis]|uniref:YeiH family protein n=1 Tax=Shinella yambaruensis TaxID=415996 RepID=UPI001FD27E8C|nr:putative sulfate exporter family transporter [Shinella yambaruensis]MCJ8030097.1 putative sulfate exporter family transporter [Shinella yambaruensis]MCU7984421.1 putative sulfate exporter family transporter [Shinella yambaruensis]
MENSPNKPAILGIRVLLPGVLLSGFVSSLAVLAERLEIRLAGGAWIEALVLAILLGAACRLLLRRPAVFDPGIAFSAKYFLEIAIVLLGAGVSATAIAGMGWPLIGAIAAVVGVVLLASYAIGRGLGLSRTVALLVACGNSICGNSAIAATAPVIRADAEDVASSIAFTAVLGMVTVLLLPVLVPLLGLSATGYGVMAGMTVYAVPQVLAATAPVSALSIQIGTFVKLVRVLMLGPVIFLLSLAAGKESGRRPALHRLVPWFILGFLAMLAARSFGLIDAGLAEGMARAATVLTILSMAALGLGIDLRRVMRAGPRVTAAVVLSLGVLVVVSYGMVVLLNLATA